MKDLTLVNMTVKCEECGTYFCINIQDFACPKCKEIFVPSLKVIEYLKCIRCYVPNLRERFRVEVISEEEAEKIGVRMVRGDMTCCVSTPLVEMAKKFNWRVE